MKKQSAESALSAIVQVYQKKLDMIDEKLKKTKLGTMAYLKLFKKKIAVVQELGKGLESAGVKFPIQASP